MLYKSLIQPHFDYCNVVWFGRFNEDMHKLNVLQKRCARIILSANYYTSSDTMFPKLAWKSLLCRSNYFKALLMYKCVNGMAPSYLCNRFNLVSNTHNINTRRAASGLLALPPCKKGHDTEYYKSSLSYSGVHLWNSLNYDVRNSQNVHCFKKTYKLHAFK